MTLLSETTPPNMKVYLFGERSLAFALAVATLAATPGCKSAGGSRWAWNPFSKGPDEAALAAAEPELPSASATPEIEESGGTAPAFEAIAQDTTPAKPPEVAAAGSTFAAVEKALPSLKEEPKTEAKLPTSVAQTSPSPAGPYDPNGYQAQVASAPVAAPAGGSRYASAGDRYSSSTVDPSLPELPPITPAPSAAGDRYASTPAPAPSMDRYGAPPAATPTETPAPVVANVPAPTTTPYPAVNTASAPAQSAYPTTPASTFAGLPDPPASQASTTMPITPIAPAGGTADPAQSESVRITTLPGEYRPGGTSTYKTSGDSDAILRY